MGDASPLDRVFADQVLITPAEAARLLGKSRSTIWRYENDKVNMSAATLLQLAELYGVSVDQLTTNKRLS